VEFLLIVLFALAVSADGFMAGIAYGLGRIRIPLLSLLVIALASAIAVTFSMACGKGLATAVDPHLASRLGALLLVVMGCYFIIRAGREKVQTLEMDAEKPLLEITIKPLGVIVQILKEPSIADLDASGVISPREAFFLGTALALDALGAGIGIAMAGFNILLTAFTVGMLKFILVNCGMWLGARVQNEGLKPLSSLISGLIFVAIGWLEFL
jgi:putative sporulation protein YtaF